MRKAGSVMALIVAVAGAVLGGTLVAVCMALTLAGKPAI
jgi:hypothetical protein